MNIEMIETIGAGAGTSRKDFGTLHATAVARNFLSKPARRRALEMDRGIEAAIEINTCAGSLAVICQSAKSQAKFVFRDDYSFISSKRKPRSRRNNTWCESVCDARNIFYKIVPEHQGNRRGSRFCGSQPFQPGMQTTLGRESIGVSRAATPRRVSSSNFHQQIARNGQRS